LGGAAAAAGVAAVAASATELAHPGTAEAVGLTWHTGVFNADNQTWVEPQNGSFPDPTLLTVRVGIAAPFTGGLSTANSAAIAAYDTTANAIGIYTTSYNGHALDARCNTSNAVVGVSNSGDAIVGASGTGTGVVGLSTSVYGGFFNGGKANVWLVPQGTAGAPATGAHLAGELVVDSTFTLWYCKASGTPGTWAALSGPHTGALNYLSAPIRIYDTRGGTPAPLPSGKGTLAGNTTTTIQVTGTDVGGLHVPAGATGVFGNLTVTNTQGPGDLILWPHGATQPNTSNINYGGGQTVANSLNVGLSAGGAMDLFVHVNGTDVILDIAGFVM
jgi:hypothetical protein